jgi:serine/threonine protein kinase
VARTEIGEETVKLIDLGVASIGEYDAAPDGPKLTHHREVLGTPEYMAPEQLWGQGVDQRTDVYAIGMSLFECLTGEVPYAGAYPDVLVQVSAATAPPSVRQRRPDVTPDVAQVIETALEKDANHRFQTAAELGRALVTASGLAPKPSTLLSASATGSGGPFDDEEEDPLRLVRKKVRSSGGGDRPSPPPTSHRRVSRAPFVTPVELAPRKGRATEARSEEISVDGMLVVAPVSLPLETPVKLRFASPRTGEMMVLEGTVRWTREARGRWALGVEFSAVPPLLRSVISEYIAMRPAAQEGTPADGTPG